MREPEGKPAEPSPTAPSALPVTFPEAIIFLPLINTANPHALGGGDGGRTKGKNLQPPSCPGPPPTRATAPSSGPRLQPLSPSAASVSSDLSFCHEKPRAETQDPSAGQQ